MPPWRHSRRPRQLGPSIPGGRCWPVKVRLRQVSGGFAQDLVFLLQQPITFLDLTQFDTLGLGQSRPMAVFDIGLLGPVMQTGLRNPEVLRDLNQRSLTLTGHRHDIVANQTSTKL